MNNHNNSHKYERIESEIKKELQKQIVYGIKDIRVSGNVNILEVKVSKDLSYAKVYIEILDEKNRDEILKGLNNAKGYMKRELAININLRKTPDLNFIIDDTLEKAKHIEDLINKIHSNQ